MNQQTAPLLKLIQLHEGHLCDAEGVAVREQLAANPLLLQQWKKLTSIYEKQVSLDEIEKIKGVDSELIADYVEQKMRAKQQEEFESSCWENGAMIREVISAVQATYAELSPIEISMEFKQHSKKTSKRMQNIVQQQCGTVDSPQSSSKYLQKIEEHQQPSLKSTSVGSLEPAIAEEDETLERLPLTRRTQSKRQAAKRRQKKQQQRWMIAGIAVAVIVVSFPVYFAMNDNGNPITIPIVKSPDSENSQPSHKSSDSSINTNLVEIPQSENKNDLKQKSPDEIRVPNLMVKQGNKETAVVKQKDKPKQLPEKQGLQIVWTQISGIAGYRTDNSLPWKGILSNKPENGFDSEIGSLTFRTLPSSWLQGKIDLGPDVVIDANSEVQIAVHAGVNQEKNGRSKNESGSMQTEIDLELHIGKIAFSHLQAGDVLKIKNGQQEWTVQAMQNNTSIGLVQQENNTQQIASFSGEIHIWLAVLDEEVSQNKEKSLKSNQAVVMTENAFGKTVRVNSNQLWRTEPPQALQLSNTLIAKVNESDNLLAALYSAPPNDLLVSTHLRFSLDPVAMVPRAASSKIETQRTAAIEWLLASPDNETTGAVWNKIAVASNGNQAALSVRVWFKAAQGKVAPNQKLLSELSTGLAAKQSLFVRQCSIHFLRQITRQPLAEYNPNKPTKSAISSVRLKARRATGSNIRRRR